MQLPNADTELGATQIAALGEHLQSLGWIDPASYIDGLSSPGAGNMNRTLRVHLQGHSVASLILKQSVPYVAKYPDIPAPIARDQSEAAFYQSIRTNPQLAARCPALLGHDQANHLLCFEDLGAGLDFTHLYKQNQASVSSTDSKLELTLINLLGWLSELHQQPVPANFPNNAAMRRLNHEHLFVLPFTARNGFAEHPHVGAWQAAFIAEKTARQRIAALGELYLESGEGITKANRTTSSTLLHGDFYPGSWLQSTAQANQAHVIDPEFSFIGPAEFDLGVFCAHLTFAGWTATAQQQLLQHYQQPANFDAQIAAQYGAVEVMRRLLGVAKLPMQTSAETQIAWLTDAAATLKA